MAIWILDDIQLGGEKLEAFRNLLRRRLRDTGKYEAEQFIGNGSRSEYKLKKQPVKPGYIYASVSGVTTEDFTVNAVDGIVTFETTPANTAIIAIEYYSLSFTDEELNDYITQGLGEVNVKIGTDYVVEGLPLDINEDFETIAHQQLALLVCMCAIREDEAASEAKGAISWRDADKSVSTGGRVGAQNATIARLLTQIHKLVKDINFSECTGHSLQGGVEPGPFVPEMVDE